MIKSILGCLLTILVLDSSAQRLMDRSGLLSFSSEATVENIEATNEQALAALDLSNGKVAVSVLIKGFRFEKALMEEHFNENYLESTKFPKATFLGNLIDLDVDKASSFSVKLLGEIEIHGVKRPLETTVDFQVTKEMIAVNTNFVINVGDFDIKIPKVVINNIAESVEVKGSFKFKRI